MDNLNNIPNVGNWGDAASKLNDNFNKVKQAVTTIENTSKNNKGYFTSLSALNTAFPSPKAGQTAYVYGEASSTNYYIYNAVNGAWVASSVEAPSVGVDLAAYTKTGGSTKTTKQVEDDLVQLAGDVAMRAKVSPHKNLANNVYHREKWIGGEDGKINGLVSNEYSISDYIDISGHEYLYLSRPNLTEVFTVAFLKADKTTTIIPLKLDGTPYTDYNVENQKSLAMKVPVGAKYIVYQTSWNNFALHTQNIQLEVGAAFTGYEPYALLINDEYMQKYAINDIVNPMRTTVKNLANNVYHREKWIGGEDGKINGLVSNEYSISDYIDISGHEYLYLSRPNLTEVFTVAFLKADKTTTIIPLKLDGTPYTDYNVENQKSLAMKVPVGAKYIVYQTSWNNFALHTQSIQLEDGTKYTTFKNNDLTVKNYEDKRTVNQGVVSLENSDKIAFYGCSYTESFYTLKNKSWINKLSNYLDIPLANFGRSGNTMLELCKAIRQNINPFHAVIGIKELKPSHIVMSNIGNEVTHANGQYIDAYLSEIKESAELIKSIGAKPIFGTDWVIDNTAVDTLLSDYCDSNGILYHPIGSIVQQVCYKRDSHFWYGHPGTRTNAAIWIEWLKFMRNIEPKQAIKVFRVRNEYKGGLPLIGDLNYDTIEQRAQIFQEINTGEYGLNNSDGSNAYYDRLNERSSYNSIVYTNEYCSLISGQNVKFSKYALIEFILPVVKPESVSVKIYSPTQGVKFYVKKSNNTTYQYEDNVGQALLKVDKSVYDLFSSEVTDVAYKISEKSTDTFYYKGRIKSDALGGYFLSFKSSNFYDCPASGNSGTVTRVSDSRVSNYLSTNGLSKHSFGFYSSMNNPLSAFEEITTTYENGCYTLNVKEYNYMQYDKLRIIASSVGDMYLNNMHANYLGGENKEMLDKSMDKFKQSGTEMNTPSGFGLSAYNNSFILNGATWHQIGSIVEYPSPNLNSDMSYIQLGYDSEGFPHKMNKTFTTNKSRGYKNLIVRVTARVNPKIYDPNHGEDGEFTQTPQVSDTSYDYGTICVGIRTMTGSPYSISRRTVDMSWAEHEFKLLVPPGTTSYDLMIWRDEFDGKSEYMSKDFPLQVCDVSVHEVY